MSLRSSSCTDWRLNPLRIRRLEALIIALVALVGACFAWELLLLRPDWLQVAAGFVPQPSVLRDGRQLYIAAGILGVTVMPHNLYLHSALVNTHPPGRSSRPPSPCCCGWPAWIR